MLIPPMPYDQWEGERLGASADDRDARRRLDHLERYLAHLRIARHHFGEAVRGVPDPLDQVLSEGYSSLDGLRQELGSHIQGRRRAPHPEREGQKEVLVFVDECGSPRLHASTDDFGAFAVGAVLVAADEYARFTDSWNGWKRSVWGAENEMIHEPNLRRRNGPFWLDGDRRRQQEAVAALHDTIRQLRFVAVVVVIRRQAYVAEYGHAGVNAILPEAPYHLALDFLTERLVFALNGEFGNGRGRLIAESRGPLEDAQLQWEFARLHIDGTSYVSARWFRQQLASGIRFGRKGDRMPGLEVADLLCRPCAEKALDPTSDPERWSEFRGKLCIGQETAHSPVGIKVVPWSEGHEGFWKS